MFAKDAEGALTASTADAVARAAEAAAFADKLAGKSGLNNVAFLRNIYSTLEEIGGKLPAGQDDAKARDLVKELNSLAQELPDRYLFNNYIELTNQTGRDIRIFKTAPKKGDPTGRMTFHGVLDYQGQLVRSIELLEGLVKQTRNTFIVNCVIDEPELLKPDCDKGFPNTAELHQELEEQKVYLKTFTNDWGKKAVVLKAVDYYIDALKK